MLAAAAGQYAFHPLLSSEEFGLGGPEFVGQSLLEAAQIDRFGDVGRIWNRDAAPGEVERMTSASTGGGVRFNLTEWLSGVVEVAVPLKGEVEAKELNEDGSGDHFRVFGSLATTF